MNSEKPKKAIIYCRVSSAEQVDGTSLDTQQQACRDYCKRRNITIERVFIERGESAKTTDRTQFLAAIDYCKQAKGQINTFVVWKLDRFARQTSDHFKVKALLSQYGVTLQSVTETIGDDPQGNLMETILAGFAQFDNDIRAQRSRNGMQEKLRNGVWVWGAPYGYCRTEKGGNLVIDPETAPLIRMVFEAYASKSHTYDSVAELLQKRGFFSQKGKAPYRQLIAKIVRNPLYCGVIRMWGEEHKGSFAPIVSPDIFNKCQERFKDRVQLAPRKAKNPEFPLRRFVVCAECQQPLTGSASTGRHGKKYPYYHHQRQACPKAAFIPRDQLETKFVEHLTDITPTPKFERSFKTIVTDLYSNRYKTIEASCQRHDRELQKLNTARQRIFEAHTKGLYSDDDFLQQKRDIDQRIAKQQSLRPDQEAPPIDVDAALDFALDMIRNAPQRWPELSLEDRARFHKLIFDGQITFDGEKFGTAKLSPIYALYRDFGPDLSTLVTPRGQIWNHILQELQSWFELLNDTQDQPESSPEALAA
jgi:site-specific DNA recombinase